MSKRTKYTKEQKYAILSHSTLQRWIKKYNSHNELNMDWQPLFRQIDSEQEYIF